MYHRNIEDIGKGSHYSKGWLGIKAPTAGEVAKIITKYPSSNCLWGNGDRKKTNFRQALWLGLDFDEGTTLEQGIENFRQYIHVIGTTKSHMLKKNGVAHHRFRVFLKFSELCVSKDDYEFTCKKWVSKYNADKACVDAARFFWPCKEIVSLNFIGKVVKILNADDEVQRKKEEYKKRTDKMKLMYPDKGIPAHIQNKLRFGTANRNIACYGIGSDLTKLGFSFEEIVSLVENSAIISNGFPINEALSAIKSGVEKVRHS